MKTITLIYPIHYGLELIRTIKIDLNNLHKLYKACNMSNFRSKFITDIDRKIIKKWSCDKQIELTKREHEITCKHNYVNLNLQLEKEKLQWEWNYLKKVKKILQNPTYIDKLFNVETVNDNDGIRLIDQYAYEVLWNIK